MGWTPQLIRLFSELKHGVTSYPVLTCFESDKPNPLKTYWSSEGMGNILMQKYTDKEPQLASIILKDNGTCLFDLSPHSARI